MHALATSRAPIHFNVCTGNLNGPGNLNSTGNLNIYPRLASLNRTINLKVCTCCLNGTVDVRSLTLRASAGEEMIWPWTTSPPLSRQHASHHCYRWHPSPSPAPHLPFKHCYTSLATVTSSTIGFKTTIGLNFPGCNRVCKLVSSQRRQLSPFFRCTKKRIREDHALQCPACK